VNSIDNFIHALLHWQFHLGLVQLIMDWIWRNWEEFWFWWNLIHLKPCHHPSGISETYWFCLRKCSGFAPATACRRRIYKFSLKRSSKWCWRPIRQYRMFRLR
jgi:hypothetical protein